MCRSRVYITCLFLLISIAFLAYAGNEKVAQKITEGAKTEVKKKTIYKESYLQIDYPNGDVPSDIGVCTDLVIRSFRNAGVDLQELILEDKKKNPADYPLYIWENKKPDKNIDHRRCQNMYSFLKKESKELSKNLNDECWQAGDVVFFKRDKKKYPWHVGIISNKKTEDGYPMMYHLFPPHAAEEPVADYAPIHSHFRWEEK